MSKIVLVTGGSRSGKSVLAENKAFEYGDGSVLYIATAIATDEDMKERIRMHQARRDERWDTHEGFKDIPEALTKTERQRHCLTALLFLLQIICLMKREILTLLQKMRFMPWRI